MLFGETRVREAPNVTDGKSGRLSGSSSAYIKPVQHFLKSSFSASVVPEMQLKQSSCLLFGTLVSSSRFRPAPMDLLFTPPKIRICDTLCRCRVLGSP
ncbi:hypothetical protein ABKN59_003328 [Abortiporus biennis]